MTRRRKLLLALMALTAAALLLCLPPAREAALAASYPITEAILQARAWTFTVLQTFNTGLKIAGSNLQGDSKSVDPDNLLDKTAAETGTGSLHLDGGIGASAGNKVNLEGAAGDTYLKRDADTSSLDSYKDGTLSEQNRGNHWIPPDCPADLNTVTFGGLCKESATGKIRYRGTLESIP